MLEWSNVFLNNNLYYKNINEEKWELLYLYIFKLKFEIDFNKDFEKNKEIKCNINSSILVL